MDYLIIHLQVDRQARRGPRWVRSLDTRAHPGDSPAEVQTTIRSLLLLLLLLLACDPPSKRVPQHDDPSSATAKKPKARPAPKPTPTPEPVEDLTDADQDGVRDDFERTLSTDPTRADSDGDGVPDGVDLAPLTPGPQEVFTAQDVLVSEPGSVLPDPEFDPETGRFAWQTFSGSNLWVGRIDPKTGDLIPPNGRGQKVDEDIGAVNVGANGPEWVSTPAGTVLTYIKKAGDGYEVWQAREIDGRWKAEALEGGPPGERPYGQHVPGSAGRIIYRTPGGEGSVNVWRELDNPKEVHLLPRERSAHNTRWVLDDEHLLLGSSPPDHPIVRHDIRTGAWTVLTTDPGVHHDPYQISAPEWGGEPVIVSLRGPETNNYPELVVYRQVDGAWTPVKIIRPPPAYPQITSPELFIWQGKTYVSFITTEWVDGPMNGVSQVWFAAIDPASTVQRRVSDDRVGERFDPEPYMGGERPWIYYTGTTSSRRETHRCELGL
jgi:hypothetical protein